MVRRYGRSDNLLFSDNRLWQRQICFTLLFNNLLRFLQADNRVADQALPDAISGDAQATVNGIGLLSGSARHDSDGDADRLRAGGAEETAGATRHTGIIARLRYHPAPARYRRRQVNQLRQLGTRRWNGLFNVFNRAWFVDDDRRVNRFNHCAVGKADFPD